MHTQSYSPAAWPAPSQEGGGAPSCEGAGPPD